MTEYASTLIGVGLLAYDEWKRAEDDYRHCRGVEDAWEAIGKKKAFARIIRHVTGREPQAFQSKQALEQFLGLRPGYVPGEEEA